MNLSREDADLFFRLMWELQFYVNRRLNILPGIGSAQAYKTVGTNDKLKVREALYKHAELLDEFVSENPAHLPEDEVQIVQSWKRRVAGDFFILRHLKRCTIFLSSGEPPKVYGVLGLYDSLDYVLRDHPLPVLVSAVLLPLKGRIIYDGMLTSRNIIFGGGIRGDLNETYQAARQNGAIIESLESGAESARKPKPHKPTRDWTPMLDAVVEMTEQLKQGENVIQGRAFSIVKASARLAQVAAHNPNNLDEIAQHAKSVHRALGQLDTAFRRAGWYDL
jgi:hypothetical protein